MTDPIPGEPTAAIARTFRWAASHWLDGVPPGHKCARLHGHNYEATITVTGPIEPDTGMVIDYAQITATIGAWIKDNWDHRHLGARDLYTAPSLEEAAAGGDPVPFAAAVFGSEPTAENLAAHLVTMARSLMPLTVVVSVTVRETPDTMAVVA